MTLLEFYGWTLPSALMAIIMKQKGETPECSDYIRGRGVFARPLNYS
jgi:hypothetical protein